MANSGIARDHFDPGRRVQDDLFGHVNGKWLDNFEIPPDRGSDGAFRELHDAAERQTRQIIEDQGPDTLVGALYASFMDAERVEALGLAPIIPDLQAIARAADRAALARVLGRLERGGVGGGIGLFVDTDPGDPARYVLNLHQAGLGLPDEAYYREDQHAAVREAYKKHLARVFGLVAQGLDDAAGLRRAIGSPQAAAGRVYALEERLAAGHWDVVKDRDATLTYNPVDLAGLAALAPGFDWAGWLAAVAGAAAPAAPGGSAGSGAAAAGGLASPAAPAWGALVVMEPSFVEAFGAAWREVALEDWQLWAMWRLVRARSGLLPDALVQASFDFYGRVLQGSQQLRRRWKRAVALVDSLLGEAVGRVYVARHFPPEHKARMVQLVEDLIEAYRQSIQELGWLGRETKQKALDKLAQFTPKIGYPDQWRDYSALALDAADLVGNARAAAAFETDRELRKLGGPVDRGEWFMTPQTVNAYYNQGFNEIVFPAAILQPPFFDAQAEDAANYGGIGGVIGHEIGHGFDDQGSKYDGAGRLADWWTDQDRAAFEARTKALISQYDEYQIELPGGPRRVNGALTVGENIGDLGGLAIAWRAYQIALRRAGLAAGPVVDGLGAAERFFYGWAQCWRQKTRPEQEATMLAVDPHSPPRFRCNGVVSNLDLFYDTFGVEPADALYLAPERRVTIW
ncbi:MAG: peptidase M13 [Bifidobacteriaceae bacterium]|jgi:putative endopeptidase|nr:peptidase M13 [Bifidobacteriaceae bacterium]